MLPVIMDNSLCFSFRETNSRVTLLTIQKSANISSSWLTVQKALKSQSCSLIYDLIQAGPRLHVGWQRILINAGGKKILFVTKETSVNPNIAAAEVQQGVRFR